MKLPEDGTTRAIVLLLLAASLVTVSFVPSLTGPVEGHEDDGDPAPAHDTSFADPDDALALRGVTGTPDDALARASSDPSSEAPALPEPRDERPLVHALAELARSGDAPDDLALEDVEDPALQSALDRADRLPDGLQRELAVLVLAVAEARDLQAEALADLDPDERRALASGDLDPDQAREIRSQVDMEKSVRAARLLDRAVQETRPALDAWSDVADSPAARTTGLATPSDPPSPAEQGPRVLEALGTPDGPDDLLRSAAHLHGAELEEPEMPPALENATLPQLLVATYAHLGVPGSPETVATLAATSGLDPGVREVTAVGLRHYLLGLSLQAEALSDLTPAERQAVAEMGPSLLEAGDSGADPLTEALAARAAQKVDRAKLLQAASAFSISTGPLGQAAAAVSNETPIADDCPDDTRDPSVEGVSPVRTDEPITCTVGNLTVTLGLQDGETFILKVDTDGDGEPDIVTPGIGGQTSSRLHWDEDLGQVTVYEDTNEDGEAQDDEIEFQTRPIRQRDNNVAFVDPYGFVVVGSDDGGTTFDDRYGRVQLPREPRDERVDRTRGSFEGQVVDGLLCCGLDPRQSGIVLTDPLFTDVSFDSRQAYEDFWQTAKHPPNTTVNPNASHILTVDLDGDSTYTRNVGGQVFHLTDFCCPAQFLSSPALAVDLGGDDTYRAGVDNPAVFLEQNFTLGAAGLWGVGTAIDVEGDDTYEAQDWTMGSSQGFAVGLFADLAGDDAYVARNQSMGAAAISDGLFYDGGGNDTYTATTRSQGFGILGETVGLFVDDGDGDDTYEADMEAGRSNFFTQVRRVAQGASLRGGVGVHLDGGGDDAYVHPDQPEEKAPHIQGVSFGNYCALFFSPFGMCNPDSHSAAGGVGLLADLGGDDDGLRITGVVDHSRLGTVGLGPHFHAEEDGVNNDRTVPLGYVIDAEVRDDPTLRPDGYVLDTGSLTWDTEKDPVARTGFTLRVPGLLAVGDTASTHWDEDHVVSLDLGGDDTYENRPGAAALVPDDQPGGTVHLSNTPSPLRGDHLTGGETYQPRLASLHVDLDGDDTYRAAAFQDSPRYRGLGYGLGGVGLHYDLARAGGDADDTYEAETQALGAGILGVGLLHDEAGDDRYVLASGDRDARGLGYGSLGGVGVLLDARGDDTYVADARSVGAYGFHYTGTASETVNQTDSGQNEVGFGLFLDRAGADTYEVPEEALGHAFQEHAHKGTVRSLVDPPGVDDRRLVGAVFVDDGFGEDDYSDAQTDLGRGNNDFWNTTALGRGFDNLDYYTHWSLVWAGDETAQRAASLLLSPSARITDPTYSQEEPLRGTETVTLNVSYGGNRSLVLNARALAVAPLDTDPNATRAEEVEQVQAALEATVDDVAGQVDPGQVDPDAAPGPTETAHYGVTYANVTYQSLLNMMRNEDNRDRPGPTRDHLDETQRGADMVLAPAGREATWPDVVGLSPGTGQEDLLRSILGFCDEYPAGQNAVNGSWTRGCESIASRIVWGFLDALFVTEFTNNLVVELVLENDQSLLGGKSPNQVIYQGFTAGHGAVDQAGSAAGESAVATPDPGLRWTLAQHLLVVKALADGLPGGDAVDAPVDEALRDIGVASPQPDVAAGAQGAATEDPSAQDCDTGLLAHDRRAYLACVVRAAFHGPVDRADAARGAADDACQAAPRTNGTANETDDGCEAAGEALPAVINPPQGGEFVRVVELHADGDLVAAVEGDGNVTYDIDWNTSALDDDGRYRWEDGNHSLTASAYYRPADPRPNRAPPSAPDDDAQKRSSDPYGFYPGNDEIVVATDNPPRMYLAHATDFNPEGPCGELQCQLNYTGVVSENLTADVAVETADGTTVHTLEGQRTDSAEDGTHWLNFTWEGVPDDGRYVAEVTLQECPGGSSGDGCDAPTHPTPFFVTRTPPETVATPVMNDAGFAGCDHAWIREGSCGNVEEALLNVSARLTADAPRSPVASFDLYWRAYGPDGKLDADLTKGNGCPGTHVTLESADGSGHPWCEVAADAPGNRTSVDITRSSGGPIEDRTLYLVARATDRAGNVDEAPLPPVSNTTGVDDEPEAEVFLDLTRPSSFPDLEEPVVIRNETRVTVPWAYEDAGEPMQDADILWKRDEAHGAEWTPLPDGRVDVGGQEAVWTPDVAYEPDHGDAVLFKILATDAAGNTEEKTRHDLKAQFDFEAPRIQEAEVHAHPSSLSLNWTSDEPLAEAALALRPAGDASENATRVVEASGSGAVQRATVANLTQNTGYVAEVRMTDEAGNRNVTTDLPGLDQPLLTSTVIDLDPIAPADGDVVSGEATVAWFPEKVKGDPFVLYNLTLAPEARGCQGSADERIPLGETEVFEGEPARREFTFDTAAEEIPDVRGAQVCVAANNTRNPDDPVVVPVPANGSFHIDNQAPTTNLTVEGPGDGEWVQGRARVVLEAEDATPGDVTTRYALDGSDPAVYTGPVPVDEDGVHEFTYWSEDALGQAEDERTAEVRVDATPPEGELEIDGGASRTGDTEVSLTVNGTDETSGVSDIVVRSADAKTHRRLPGSLLAGGAVEVPWTLAPGDGRKEVQVVLVDEAGNQLSLRRTITLDTTPPSFGRAQARSVGFTQAGIEWTTDEPTTGTVLLKEEGSPAFEGSVESNESGVRHAVALENLTPATTYVVEIAGRDELGNEASTALSFTTAADNTPPGPVQGLEAEADDNGFVELEWEEAFDEVGVASYVVSRDAGDGFVQAAETPRTVLLDDEAPPGETVGYRVQAVDVGGNAGPPSEVVEVTTLTAPEVLEASVTPEQGTPADLYTYEVVVRDRDGDELERVSAVIDGEHREMIPLGGGDVQDGVTYTLETGLEATTLSQGTHTYAFHATDGTHETRWPADDEAKSGPVVVEAGDGGEVAGFGAAVERAVPGPVPVLVLAVVAAGAILHRRWTP